MEDAGRASSARWLRPALLFGGLAVSMALAWPWLRRQDTHAEYVRNAVCIECHEAAAKDWAASHHYQAMAPANDATVLGDFSGTEFARDGVVSRFLHRDGKFVVHTDGSDGTLADFDVAYTFGVRPLQQYLIAQPGGRLQGLTIAWDTERRRWFHLYPDEKTPPGDVLHWTGRYQSWNAMCAPCHSTNLQKNYDARADRYVTTWSEINVSCQSTTHSHRPRPTTP